MSLVGPVGEGVRLVVPRLSRNGRAAPAVPTPRLMETPVGFFQLQHLRRDFLVGFSQDLDQILNLEGENFQVKCPRNVEGSSVVGVRRLGNKPWRSGINPMNGLQACVYKLVNTSVF